jgi:hypothetical protein
MDENNRLLREYSVSINSGNPGKLHRVPSSNTLFSGYHGPMHGGSNGKSDSVGKNLEREVATPEYELIYTGGYNSNTTEEEIAALAQKRNGFQLNLSGIKNGQSRQFESSRMDSGFRSKTGALSKNPDGQSYF